MTEGTLEYFMEIAHEQGKGILWHKLRGQFPHMRARKFEELYQLILDKAGVKHQRVDDWNFLGV
jgi:hypothetical protein